MFRISWKSFLCPCFLGFAGILLTGCMTSDDARILQILNERGFGRKYTGNANEVFYYGIGDTFAFEDSFNQELRGTAKIRMDGTVDFPELGETYVAGLTSKEIASMLNMRLSHYYKFVDVQIRPLDVNSKRIFIHLDTDRNYVKKFTGDQTLYDVVLSVKYDSIDVDLDNVKLVRADPVHPLVMYCDMDNMIHNGLSRDNVLVKEDDIIYFTPSLIGYLKRFVKTLLSPLKPVVQLFQAANQINIMTESFGDDGYYGGRGRYGGYNY